MSECTVDNLVYLRELLGLGRAFDKLDNDAVGSDVSEGKPLLEGLEVPLPGLVVVNEVCLPDLPDLLNFPLELALDESRLLRELQVLLIAGHNDGRLLGQDSQVVKDFIEDVSGLSEFLPTHKLCCESTYFSFESTTTRMARGCSSRTSLSLSLKW
jgi:hypothetical protein